MLAPDAIGIVTMALVLLVKRLRAFPAFAEFDIPNPWN
jgi:hypothetical protein